MHWTYEKLKKDLLQSRYNLRKSGLFDGEIKDEVNRLLHHLNEIEKELKTVSNEFPYGESKEYFK